jgi:hypothetical protein
MAALVATNTSQQRHVIGDLVAHFYTLSGNNGDTFVAAGSQILIAEAQPTTNINIGTTVSGNTITFQTAGAWAATVMVISRVG